MVHSQSRAPGSRNKKTPSRRSPAQIAKPRYSHAAPRQRRKAPSASTVWAGRRGRRKPYTSPRPAPSSKAQSSHPII